MSRLTIFLGAFLAFLVQPLVGNTLLPAFGGTATVWNWCLAGFQILLVAGYFYAHRVTSRRFNPSVHCTLVTVSAIGLVAVALVSRSPWAVIPLVAIPYVLLAANSSLVQELDGGKYSLYSISNLGSFLGLFTYPFVFEPLMPLWCQWLTMAILIVAYATLLFILARGKTAADSNYQLPSTNYQLSSTNYQLSTFSLAFASCFLLNAVTAHLCSDITPIPLMWAVLLGVYLLSYVIAFTEWGSKRRWWIAIPAALIPFYAILRLVLVGGQYFLGETITATLVLFLGGLEIHSKLYRIRPSSAELTRFYLLIAIGGACGGAFCSFAMPHLAVTVAEYPVTLAMVWYVAIGAKRMPWKLPTGLVAAMLAAFGIYCQRIATNGQVLARYRNEYGTGAVVRRPMKQSDGRYFLVDDFRCNSTTHGIQIFQKDGLLYAPTAYFTPEAGGAAIMRHPKYASREPMRVAVLGMGMGTLAAYSRPGDTYMMCEINPVVRDFALNRRFFTFIPEAKGKIEIVVDDARKALERERAADLPRYDVIFMDVFNGDSVPPHLATREAFELYRDRLAPDGILAVNLTNWHLDLLPMVKAAAKNLGWNLLAVDCLPSAVSAGACWGFLSPRPLDALHDAKRQVKIDLGKIRDLPQMTDEFHSLLPFLIRR